MSNPLNFTSASPRHKLPYLFAGQSQKEFTVNQALALADTLLHPVVEGVANDPPTGPQSGECWIVGGAPTGVWSDHAGAIAAFVDGAWLFAAPTVSMRVHDLAAGQAAKFDGTAWQYASAVASPAGGTTIDSEARAAIDQLKAALQTVGLISPG